MGNGNWVKGESLLGCTMELDTMARWKVVLWVKMEIRKVPKYPNFTEKFNGFCSIPKRSVPIISGRESATVDGD